MTDIAGLLEKVRAATGPDRELDFMLQIHVAHPMTGNEPYTLQDVMDDFALLGPDGMTIDAPYTASVDAALALVERKLPGWGYDLSMINGKARAGLWRPRALGPAFHGFSDGSMPLAILAALLSALSSGDAS